MAQMPGEGWDDLGRSCHERGVGRGVLPEVRLERRFCLGEAWRLRIGGLLAVFERATETVLGRKFIVRR